MPEDLDDLIRAYSLRGFSDWRDETNRDLRRSAGGFLVNTIVESEEDVDLVIEGQPGDRKFIPMPKHGSRNKGFEWCFFLPMKVKGKLKSFILFVLVRREKNKCRCIAFRFEEGRSNGRHGYAHVQLTSRLEKTGLGPLDPDAGKWIPKWLPASYPAFPIPARNWTEMFLALATAVHGRGGGIDVLIQEIFVERGGANKAQAYMNMLDGMLCKLNLNADS